MAEPLLVLYVAGGREAVAPTAASVARESDRIETLTVATLDTALETLWSERPA